MHLSRLRALVAVAEEGSFSAAARTLGCSQPAVSQQIKALEQELGVELLTREHDPVRPTAAGAAAVEKARRILALWEELAQAARRAGSGPQGPLTVGASTVPATYLLPGAILRLREVCPGAEVKVRVGDSAAVQGWVLARQVDVGAVGFHRPHKDLVHVEAGQDELLLIAPCNHPWARGEPVDPAELAQAPFLCRAPGSGTREAAERVLAEWGLSPDRLRPVAELGSTEAQVAAVEAGLGVALVSGLAAGPAVARGRVCVVRLRSPAIVRRFYLIYRRSREGDPLLERFVDCARRPLARSAAGGELPWNSAS